MPHFEFAAAEIRLFTLLLYTIAVIFALLHVLMPQLHYHNSYSKHEMIPVHGSELYEIIMRYFNYGIAHDVSI